MAELVLNFYEALEAVLEHARKAAAAGTTPCEIVRLQDAPGRVLADRVLADRDQPPFDRATRDGFAIRAANGAEPRQVVGSVRAGEAWSGPAVQAGEAVEIMTGAALPNGTDAVVMIEHVEVSCESITLVGERTLKAGENVVKRGAEAHAGMGVLRAGTMIGAAEIAVAASCGCVTLPAFRRPTVAIVATGDELVELNVEPDVTQIRNSNSYALEAMVSAEGGVGERVPIARDNRKDLELRIAQGTMFDLMVLSGGVSMGKYDFVEEVLADRGAEFFFTGAKIQPGKPVVFGRLPKNGSLPYDETATNGEWTYFFGLPGNPVSTQVTFLLFVAPMLRALAGREEIAPRFVEARLADNVKNGAKVTRFLPAELQGDWQRVTVRVVGWQGSGDVAANARGNGYVVLPIGDQDLRAGETVRVLLR